MERQSNKTESQTEQATLMLNLHHALPPRQPQFKGEVERVFALMAKTIAERVNK